MSPILTVTTWFRRYPAAQFLIALALALVSSPFTESGASFHVDATVAQHLPSFGGFIGVGANGFYYKQITGDSGSGARLGDFEGMTTGVGSVLSYVRPMGKTQLVAELKWLPGLDVEKRMKGDSSGSSWRFCFEIDLARLVQA
jgi:hypothetical protein